MLDLLKYMYMRKWNNLIVPLNRSWWLCSLLIAAILRVKGWVILPFRYTYWQQCMMDIPDVYLKLVILYVMPLCMHIISNVVPRMNFKWLSGIIELKCQFKTLQYKFHRRQKYTSYQFYFYRPLKLPPHKSTFPPPPPFGWGEKLPRYESMWNSHNSLSQ